jgi:diphosphomevalonate decarboxylase
MSVSPLSRLQDMASPGRLSLHENLSAAWQSPSNIAIVKYWGKKDGQLPATPSLSMTLDLAVSKTSLLVSVEETPKGLISVNDDPNHPFLPKMQQFFHWMTGEIPLFNKITATVTTHNSFPHSTGIASSASGMSAFTLCLLSVANRILEAGISTEELIHLASYAARMGSGSACRSLYKGFTVWGKSTCVPASADEYAIPVNESVHPEMLSLRDAILVISGNPKSLPSTLGHRSMNGHPFFSGRIGQANHNLEEALHALASNDFEKLSFIAECEALTLHALIMSADPGTILMKPATLLAIDAIRNARKGGLPLFFTLDAGANVHVMYPATSEFQVEKYINDVLRPLCEDGRVIFDGCGRGPVCIEAR